MNRAKSIILFTIGNIDHPSSRIRGIQYIPFLEKAGYKVKWIPRIPPKPKNSFERFIIFPFWKRGLSLLRIYHLIFSKPDYFFIQKIFVSEWLLKRAKNGNSKIIFDFDDAIYLDKNNSNAKDRTTIMLKYANKVIVSNNTLADYCNKMEISTSIITTPIDIHRVFPNKITKNKIFTIGWLGSFWTTPYLKLIEESLQTLAQKYQFRLLLVGADKSYKIEGVNTEHLKWEFDKEPEYLNLFDIGIMPLSRDEYSEAKGGYKLLMYMAAGIPQIASPIGINKDIIIHNQTGFLAKNTQEWIDSLSFFIENPEKCSMFGTESRKLAESKYSREVCFEKMLKVLDWTH